MIISDRELILRYDDAASIIIAPERRRNVNIVRSPQVLAADACKLGSYTFSDHITLHTVDASYRMHRYPAHIHGHYGRHRSERLLHNRIWPVVGSYRRANAAFPHRKALRIRDTNCRKGSGHIAPGRRSFPAE